ncbi:MlaD family protein [Roseisolibacter sp. H3M3-2]|uniref:MlaD family protein n=1 Tax=Roseisolibacter sp. H3M3-2 TaxID=3031323 RepID=UPI0023D9C10D|nr:MlaD family protein [Roseisolibacter sp. H3M3-2]MDF1504836.1 MlaD family protein [Roseisolibacter sp. H3M3-2]
MSRATTWRDLRLGVAALVVVVVGALGVLRWARVGALHGDTEPLYAATPHGRGVLPGSEVWLDGVKVGVVREVGFRPPSADTLTRVLLALDVLTEAMPRIARDAPVEVRPGGSFIGSPIVAITSRAAGEPLIRAGDTLVSRRSRELDQARADLALAASEVPVILDNLTVLASQLRSARSTLGALGVEGPDRLAETGAAVGGVMQAVRGGNGTLPLMMRRGEPMARARLAMALGDSVRRLLDGPSSSIGRLRRDSTLLRTVDDLRAELTRVQAALAEPRGTAGRLQHDSALVRRVAATRAEMDALAADLRRNPLRYLSF